jgi:hypothetical protein
VELNKELGALLMMPLIGIVFYFLRQSIEGIRAQISALWDHINNQTVERAAYREKIAREYYTKDETEKLIDWRIK